MLTEFSKKKKKKNEKDEDADKNVRMDYNFCVESELRTNTVIETGKDATHSDTTSY